MNNENNYLFTYTIPYDDGAAPNPFHGVCTLAICKPGIRRTASIGDWVAGFGSKNAPSGDLSGKLVYAMKVSEIMSLEKYNDDAPMRWPNKIPDVGSNDLVMRLGDCIYHSFKNGKALRRNGVHNDGNIDTDLSGVNVLISDHFYYFGSKAIDLPTSLSPVLHQTQGHKKQANNNYFSEFVDWINNQKLNIGEIYGQPDMMIDWSDNGSSCAGCSTRQYEAENDVEDIDFTEKKAGSERVAPC